MVTARIRWLPADPHGLSSIGHLPFIRMSRQIHSLGAAVIYTGLYMKPHTNTRRIPLRLVLFIGLLGAIALVATGLKLADVVSRRKVDRTPWAQRCFRASTRSLGLKIRCHGVPSDQPALYVCNHVSWCDIPVLGGAMPAVFLSKAEVSQWPLIGWLARQAGTVFIKRGGGRVADVASQLEARLSQGQSVMVFPEATTSPGITVLPFHGRLLKAAQQAGVPLQPVSIVYRRDGALDHLAPFINEDSFMNHLRRLLQNPAPTVDILMHSPMVPSPDDKPSELAARLRSTVLEGVNQIQDGALDANPTDSQPPLRHQSLRAFR